MDRLVKEYNKKLPVKQGIRAIWQKFPLPFSMVQFGALLYPQTPRLISSWNRHHTALENMVLNPRQGKSELYAGRSSKV
jgi:hypothetical protein